MTFTIEVLLKETDRVVTETVEFGARSPDAWTDEDVHGVLERMLQAIARAKNPSDVDSEVSLRGLSWIVDAGAAGVVIAIEIPSGAVVAGPFEIVRERLDAMVGRVLARVPGNGPSVVH
jgi:hypothetical protein